jgi:hypothetical protein
VRMLLYLLCKIMLTETFCCLVVKNVKKWFVLCAIQ